MTPYFQRLKDLSIVYIFMTLNAEHLQAVQCCLATNQKKKTRHLPESQMQTSPSVIVSADLISLGQKKNNFNGNKSSNLV